MSLINNMIDGTYTFVKKDNTIEIHNSQNKLIYKNSHGIEEWFDYDTN